MVGQFMYMSASCVINFLKGTPATTSQMAKDVVTFLAWTAEPEHDERKKLGLKAVIILASLTAISVYVKRFKWASIKTRKIGTHLSSNLILSYNLIWGYRHSLQPS